MPIREWIYPLSDEAAAERERKFAGVTTAGRSAFPAVERSISALDQQRPDDVTDRKNMTLLIQLRWLAILGQVITIAIVETLFRINLPLLQMASVLCCLFALNIGCLAWLQNRTTITNLSLFAVLACDVLALAVQLYLSGGASNPFIFLFLMQVTLGAVLLDTRSSWAIALLACLCFAVLVFHFKPLGSPDVDPAELFRLHIFGMFVCCVLDVGLVVLFVARINRNLRERDARLAALRQHAAEEDHIVRMGLLASGAAHELGTPLSSVSVILGDWRHMPVVAGDPAMMQDIDDMQAELKRCKTIVTGILMSAGEARGEAPQVVPLKGFFDHMVEEWRAGRTAKALSYVNVFDREVDIVADSALKQVLFNVLDNALEASPRLVEFAVKRQDETLVLEVSDRGPGFAADILAEVGKPYRSTKNKPGGGLGLFLVFNVVRKLGGTVSVQNHPRGGAVVRLELPIATLAVEEPADAA